MNVLTPAPVFDVPKTPELDALTPDVLEDPKIEMPLLLVLTVFPEPAIVLLCPPVREFDVPMTRVFAVELTPRFVLYDPNT